MNKRNMLIRIRDLRWDETLTDFYYKTVMTSRSVSWASLQCRKKTFSLVSHIICKRAAVADYQNEHFNFYFIHFPKCSSRKFIILCHCRQKQKWFQPRPPGNSLSCDFSASIKVENYLHKLPHFITGVVVSY